MDMKNQDYTEKELIALKNFRHRISDLDLDWFTGHAYSLMRWLRARDLNVDKAEYMIRQNVEWRKQNGIDNIVNTSIPEFMFKAFPFKVLGFDKNGAIVAVVPYGKWDFRTLVESGHKEELVHYVNFIIELAYKLSKNRSTPDKMHCKLIIILDVEGFSIRQVLHKPTIEFLLGILQDLENNHPEVLECGFLFNCPKIWEILWTIAKPLMTVRTLSKITIEGSKASTWRSKLLEIVPHDILPSQYGGSHLTVPEITLYYQRLLHTDLSKKFDLKFEQNRTIPDDQLEPVVVEAASTFETEVNIPSTGCVLRFGFRTDHHDIGFAIYNDDGEKIVNVGRADSYKNTQLGTLRCPPGQERKYVFSFDNSYSRFTAKNLFYKIDMCELDEEEDLSDDYGDVDLDDDSQSTDDSFTTDL